MKRIIKKLEREVSKKVQKIITDRKGSSEVVSVIALIIIVLVVIAVIFAPQISAWFKETVMPGLKNSTSNLFNFKG